MDLFDLLFGVRDLAEEKKNNARVRRIQSESRVLDAHTSVVQSQRALDEALLESRRSLTRQEFESRTDLAFLEASLRTRLADAMGESEDAQRKFQLRQYARSLPAADAIAFLQGESHREQALGDYDATIRFLRQGTGGLPPRQLPAPPPPRPEPDPPPPPPPDPPIQRRLSQEEVDRRAFKAVKDISALPKEKHETAWEEWRKKLRTEVPPLVAEEIAKRAETLRTMAR
ncbi:hypothetical protein [Armatimonas rosea]|uniref:Uncharacterized protein n=1 Tax=Armatimonas rosea TaxID=685828 RepID=A0A7W9SXW0_ARMRO|nr:hypothetical protein [Armatimonas rosea]MBB6053864.1 hypothetical protein [Armatimonas rosea]